LRVRRRLGAAISNALPFGWLAAPERVGDAHDDR
jgi:hypothetical protein